MRVEHFEKIEWSSYVTSSKIQTRVHYNLPGSYWVIRFDSHVASLTLSPPSRGRLKDSYHAPQQSQ